MLTGEKNPSLASLTMNKVVVRLLLRIMGIRVHPMKDTGAKAATELNTESKSTERSMPVPFVEECVR